MEMISRPLELSEEENRRQLLVEERRLRADGSMYRNRQHRRQMERIASKEAKREGVSS